MTQNKDSQAEMTPDRALELLVEGHQRFMKGEQKQTQGQPAIR